MAKCGACGRFLSSADGVACKKCSGIYHKPCVAIPISATVNTKWSCPNCKIKEPKDNSASTPVRSVTTEYTTEESNSGVKIQMDGGELNERSESSEEMNLLAKELRLSREENSKFRIEFKTEMEEFRKEISEFKVLVTSFNQRLDTLERRIEILEKEKELSSPSSGASQDLAAVVTKLQYEIKEREQDLLLNDIEIANFPEQRGEKAIHLTALIGVKLGVTIDEKDIVCAERIGARKESSEKTRPRSLVVRFARRALRDEMLRSARVRRNITTSEMDLEVDNCRFYLNERLTRVNRLLFNRSREEAKRCGWRYVWTKQGRIYARKTQGDQAFRIRSESDLSSVFGIPTVSSE